MKSGFTILEIMIVMVIIGVGLLSVVPVITERTVRGDEQVAFFNDLLAEHLQYAVEYGVPISIVGYKGSANIQKFDGSRVSIPEIRSVQSVIINDERTPGVEYHINVYPDGLCDHFVIETDRKDFIESYPLLMTVMRKLS